MPKRSSNQKWGDSQPNRSARVWITGKFTPMGIGACASGQAIFGGRLIDTIGNQAEKRYDGELASKTGVRAF
ncbi:MAG: hypothetical protein RIE06_30205 [Roseibium album]|uniref:hypothetical protein n=1 Tax=Roseibium album TaxID=311410 RepID=UPI0032EBC560